MVNIIHCLKNTVREHPNNIKHYPLRHIVTEHLNYVEYYPLFETHCDSAPQ
jgi:hypothetical protein